MSSINTDRSFREFLRQLMMQLSGSARRQVDEEDLDELVKTVPAAVVFGGLSLVLASRKLIIVLQKAVAAGQVTADQETSISAAFFYFALKEPGWIGEIRTIVESQKNIWIVRNFLLHMLHKSYVDAELSDHDRGELAQLCLEIIARSTSYGSKAEEAQHRSEVLQSFRTDRLRGQARRKFRDAGEIEA